MTEHTCVRHRKFLLLVTLMSFLRKSPKTHTTLRGYAQVGGEVDLIFISLSPVVNSLRHHLRNDL